MIRTIAARAVFSLIAVMMLGIGAQTAQGADIDGAQDHPLITRYPGQDIQWQQIENFRPYKVPAGPVTGYRTIGEWIETAGRVTRTFYSYEKPDRTVAEIWKNFSDALKAEGFEIIVEGVFPESNARGEVGARGWQHVVFTTNAWSDSNWYLGTMVSGTSSSGGSGAIVAKKDRAAGTVYVVINLEQHSSKLLGTLIDIVEVQQAETGLVTVDAEAIGKDMVEKGRVVLDGILFEFDKAVLKPESAEALTAIRDYLAANPGKKFYVVGHTDSKGTFAYNMDLSRDRARAVVTALETDYGIEKDRLEPHGVGPLNPVWSNGSDEGREQNRRVELVER